MQQNMQNRKKIIINEPSNSLRKRGREALEGNWLTAFFVSIINVMLMIIPVYIMDEFFGREISVKNILMELHMKYGMNFNFDEMNDAVIKKPGVSGLYILLITGALTYGVSLYFMKMYRKQNSGVADVFSGFEFFLKATGLYLYISFFSLLWLMVPIAGFILAPIALIRYSQSFYIMIDHPQYSISQCVRESKFLMSGNKLSFFMLSLSFIGWIIVAAIPVGIVDWVLSNVVNITDSYALINVITTIVGGIGLYFVVAYMESSKIGFYEILSGKVEADVYTPGEY